MHQTRHSRPRRILWRPTVISRKAAPGPLVCGAIRIVIEVVHRAAALLHAFFRPHLAMRPLRFANPSPPSGWVEDFHLQAVVHTRHTSKGRPAKAAPTAPLSAVRWTTASLATPTIINYADHPTTDDPMTKSGPKLGGDAPTIGRDRGGSRPSHPTELSSRTFAKGWSASRSVPSIDCELSLA
jgi:hypothetical protein